MRKKANRPSLREFEREAERPAVEAFRRLQVVDVEDRLEDAVQGAHGARRYSGRPLKFVLRKPGSRAQAEQGAAYRVLIMLSTASAP